MKNKICEEISKVAQNFVKSKYENAPTCHLKILMDRYTKARAHFYAFDIDQKEKADINVQKEMKQEAAASKTTHAMTEIK